MKDRKHHSIQEEETAAEDDLRLVFLSTYPPRACARQPCAFGRFVGRAAAGLCRGGGGRDCQCTQDETDLHLHKFCAALAAHPQLDFLPKLIEVTRVART